MDSASFVGDVDAMPFTMGGSSDFMNQSKRNSKEISILDRLYR